MKNTIILLSLLLNLCLFNPLRAQVPARANSQSVHKLNKPINNVQLTKPLPGNASPSVQQELSIMDKQALMGQYKYTWTLDDGTKVTNTFKLGNKIALSVPMNPNAQGKKENVMVRSQQISGDDDWDCITKETRISLDDESFLTVDNAAQAANIYPGAVYTFNNYVSGNWKGETEGRNPITISTPVRNLSGSSNVFVESPDVNSIRDAINTLTGRFTTITSQMSNGGFKMVAKEITSQADASLKIGASGHGFGASASYLFDTKSTDRKKYFFVDCIQEQFVIDMEHPAGGLFQDPARASSDMMYISSVTYGVRALVSIETTIATKEVAHKFNASYDALVGGAEAGLDSYVKDFNEQTTIKIYGVGGPMQAAYPVTNQKEIVSLLQGIFKQGNYATAQPIKYTFRNMQGEVVMTQSATDFFLTQSCTPKPDPEAPTLMKDDLVKVKLAYIKRGTDSDWELYGQVWAQVYDAQGREIFPMYGKDRLLAIDPQNRLNDSDGLIGYRPDMEAVFSLKEGQRNGAFLTVWYWLHDYDGGSGDDFLSMRGGNMGRNKNNHEYFFRRIPLSELSAYTQKSFKDTFTDGDGDSFTEAEISVAVSKAQ